MSKTNAIRILESRGIRYTAAEYEIDEDELDAVSVARKIGAPPETVFKTLVTIGDKTGHTVFVIPGNSELNLKKAAQVSGNKKIEMIKMKDLLPVTGYIRGGCSPVGMKKLFPTFIDETAQLYDAIYVSPGARGTQVCLSPLDLQGLIDAKFADLV
ncbi:MAG TPA: Cys-tRNA(Pro) deacylase [Spirochaetota bacterium]|nr:Cys-tRNA(Pro) deacylase [Spirochaetota bacterium]HPC42860.1 Cys-tRNA(Pro) deacylase [Spirochaetota bacterium]HPL16785.1 Cys-tRNA(Pro) deacylase [Spirochaetota bacterium]HQF07132.1 Cys-tRNA(Pro) deacylase [Spirochaetota bacterium]HQH95869.1 Cys-tRNA(Pro) deacylase [Spirochaetota bacterium]